MLFGSMFGGGSGSGPGLLPLLILGGIAYFLYKKFSKPKQGGSGYPDAAPPYTSQSYQQDTYDGGYNQAAPPPPPPPSSPVIGANLVEEGLAQIRQYDRNFDAVHFKDVASDVFFQVQAGWMRRDLDSYRHLLGDTLAREYEQHFAEMRAKGEINKLESIAVRSVDIVAAGSDGREDFVTLRFLANLLDYTVDDKTGALRAGSMTMPVKFEEDWTWARPVGTQSWKLEGLKVV
jgi:predicted lipid-binding transport protein (Tim44 family)